MKKLLLLMFLGIFLIGIVSAIGEVSYCCEKTIDGAWCQNAPEEQCSTEIDLLQILLIKKSRLLARQLLIVN